MASLTEPGYGRQSLSEPVLGHAFMSRWVKRCPDLSDDWPEKAKPPDDRRAISVGNLKESSDDEIDNASIQFVEAEIKEHQAVLIRQMVLIEVIICLLSEILAALHH